MSRVADDVAMRIRTAGQSQIMDVVAFNLAVMLEPIITERTWKDTKEIYEHLTELGVKTLSGKDTWTQNTWDNLCKRQPKIGLLALSNIATPQSSSVTHVRPSVPTPSVFQDEPSVQPEPTKKWEPGMHYSVGDRVFRIENVQGEGITTRIWICLKDHCASHAISLDIHAKCWKKTSEWRTR